MNKKASPQWENVKMKKSLVNKLRKNKKKTGVTIMSFVHQAVTEKLNK